MIERDDETGTTGDDRTVVSVVVVTYNAQDCLPETLQSIASQSVADFEVLVIDGASKDSTLALVEPYRAVLPGLKVWSEPDAGLYDAMNKGVAKARGRYVIFMNAGDVFHDEGVLSAFSAMTSALAPDYPALVYGHTKVRFHDGKQFTRLVRPLSYIRHGQPTIHQSVFFLTEAHRRFPYPFERWPISSDYAVMAAMQAEKGLKTLVWDRIVSQFNNNPAGISNRNLVRRMRDAWTIQHAILGTSLMMRMASAGRRVVAHCYYNLRLSRGYT